MSGTRRRSSLATARCGRMVLPPGPGVAAHQTFDIHRGPRPQQFQRFLDNRRRAPSAPRRCCFIGDFFVQPARGFRDHFLSPRGERARLVGKAVDRRSHCRRPRPVCSAPSPDAMPGCRAALCCWSGYRLSRAASPLFAAGNQFEFDHALGAEVMRDFAVEVLRSERHEDCHGIFFSAASTSGRRTICGKCGEPISSSPSATKTKLTGSLRPAPRMACSAARNVASGPFWFTAPRPTTTLPKPGLIDNARLQRRRRPFRGIDLLHVIHEVKTKSFGRARVQRGEDSGLAVGGDSWLPAGSRRRAAFAW